MNYIENFFNRLPHIDKNETFFDRKLDTQIYNRKKIIFKNIKTIKWKDLPKEIRFKKIKTYLENNRIKIDMMTHVFRRVTYDTEKKTIIKLQIIYKHNV